MIEIKKMKMEDLENIKEILQEDFDDFWSYSILKSELENENSKYFIAMDNKEIIGFAGILKIIDTIHIMNIVTKKTRRNQGIATTLLKYIIKISKQDKEITSLTLEVNENNIPARMLYQKFKFKKIGIRKKYYNNTDNAIIMTLFFNNFL